MQTATPVKGATMLLQHSFHGQIEPIREVKGTLPTLAVEGIEITVFITVVYFIFYKFNKHIFAAKKVQKPVQEKFQPKTGLVFPVGQTSGK